MVQGTKAIDGVRQQKECCPWRTFLRTVPLDAHDIAVRPEHFVLMQELRSSRPCVQLSFLWTCSLLELQNEALFDLAFPHRNVVAIGILLPASVCFSQDETVRELVSETFPHISQHFQKCRVFPLAKTQKLFFFCFSSACGDRRPTRLASEAGRRARTNTVG